MGGGKRIEVATAECFQEIDYDGRVDDVVDDDTEEEDDIPVVNNSPIKKVGMDSHLRQAGIVVRRKDSLDKEKVLKYLTAALSNLTDEEREAEGTIQEVGDEEIFYSKDSAQHGRQSERAACQCI